MRGVRLQPWGVRVRAKRSFSNRRMGRDVRHGITPCRNGGSGVSQPSTSPALCVNHGPRKVRRFSSGSPGRTRTADPVVNSHLLYRLSYRGIVVTFDRGIYPRTRRVSTPFPPLSQVRFEVGGVGAWPLRRWPAAERRGLRQARNSRRSGSWQRVMRQPFHPPWTAATSIVVTKTTRCRR